MSRNYDNWDRLVEAVLRREKDRQLAYCESLSTCYSADLSSRFSFDSAVEDADFSFNLFVGDAHLPADIDEQMDESGPTNWDLGFHPFNDMMSEWSNWDDGFQPLNDMMSAVKQIMSAELSCPVNQLPPQRIIVNDKPLSIEELVMLQSCPNPPKKLRPGRYWYDKVSGFWGKEGEKPSQVISPLQAVGFQIRQDASNGDTNVLINGREITNAELWLLWAAGIHCEGNPHFWITADGSCQHEGMNNVMAKIWKRKLVKMVCLALSLPFPSDTSNPGGKDTGRDRDNATAKKTEQCITNKLLLVGCD